VYSALKMDVPEGEYLVPLSSAKVVRQGEHVTVVTWGAMLIEALLAADEVKKQGIEAEVIDLRTLWPLDGATVVESVKKTGRLVIVHEAAKACGLGAEIVAQICEQAFLHLEAPPRRVTGWDTPFPYTHENEYLPLAHRIAPALVETVNY
jgi:2-oxoisovalerate dehydrogenase E1 component beta subunit